MPPLSVFPIPSIVILMCLFGICMYALRLQIKDREKLMYNLNYYRELANKYGLQLTRIGELAEEYDNTSKDLHTQTYAEIVETVIYNIKSLVKLAGK